jgi:hypothetical protein
LSEAEYRLTRLHHLPDLETSRRDHTSLTCAQLGIAKRLFGRAQLRVRSFKRAFCNSQSFLRLLERHARRETGSNETALPIKRGSRHAQLRLRRRHRRARSIKIRLLLRRVEPGQHFARIDMRSNVHQPLAHASTDPK